MAELVDAHDSKSCIARCESSILSPGTMNQDEYLDLVDADDHVVGRELRSVVYRDRLGFFRTINLFILNSKGELWIPRRTAHKNIAPLGLDFSCAGHVESGDTYDATLKKEVSEELNLDIGTLALRQLGKTPPQDEMRFFQMSYEAQSDEVPQYNPDDFTEYFWMTPQETVRRIESGEPAKATLAPLIRLYYL
jgi:isopentenyldiphosphate isomerase